MQPGTLRWRPSIWPIAPLIFCILGSAAAWLLLFSAIPPSDQDFPLGDDWAFARSFFRLAGRGHVLDYANWASMPQFGQWAWAWPFCQLLGYSHVTLRI